MDYLFETSDEMIERRYFVVICYDIYDNKRRRNFVKFASRYALRVQRSVFEGKLSKNKYEDLISKVVISYCRLRICKSLQVSGNWRGENMGEC